MKASNYHVTCGKVRNVLVIVLALSLTIITPAMGIDYSVIAGAGSADTDAVIIEFNINADEVGRYLIFGLGPTLAKEGWSGVAADPLLALNKEGITIDRVNNWRDHPSASAVEDFTKRDGSVPADVEAVMVRDLQQGTYKISVVNVEEKFGKVRVGITKDVSSGGSAPGEGLGITPGLWRGGNNNFEGCLNVSADGKKITKVGSTCVGKGQRDVDGINIQIDQWNIDDCGDDSGYIDWNNDVIINDGKFEITDNSARPWFPLTIKVEGVFIQGRAVGTLTKTIDGFSCQGYFELMPATASGTSQEFSYLD